MTFAVTLIDHRLAPTANLSATSTWTAESHERLLDAGLSAGVMLPYSCRGGQCGTCKAVLRSGEVTQQRQDGLTQAEISNSYILLCQSTTRSDVIIELHPITIR